MQEPKEEKVKKSVCMSACFNQTVKLNSTKLIATWEQKQEERKGEKKTKQTKVVNKKIKL